MPLNERKANISVPEGELARQREYAEAVRSIIEAKYSEPPKAFVHTYGCQGNVADGERLKGMLADMGYELVEELEGADLVLYNTCAIREHAEDRVFGNVGALKGMKNCQQRYAYPALRLHDAAGARRREDKKQLPLCRYSFRHSCHPSPARAAL